MLIVHSPRCLEYAAPGHPESPERVRATAAALKEYAHTWLVPQPCDESDLLRVHSPVLLRAVKQGRFSDPDTPFFPNIYELARLSAGAAILAAESAIARGPAFSLMRPPGHHAERDRPMGFCYFNNVAVAVARLLEKHNLSRVAILDFDCHHGNGTERIFTGDARVMYASLHQSPCFPGTGLESTGNILNYPLPPGTGPNEFLAALDDALAKLREFAPQALAISAGFDSYEGDPITQMTLQVDTFGQTGARIRQFCQQAAANPAAPLPAFATLEGGYSDDLPRCVAAFIEGWQGR
jgi:acetoin utilization deacetylase AcuC-like enzyme